VKVNQLNCSYFLSDYIGLYTFLFISLFLLAAITFFILKYQSTAWSRLGLLMVVIGGLHNLYRRVVYNCVEDHIDFFKLFMFNPADVLVTLGIVLILYNLLKNE